MKAKVARTIAMKLRKKNIFDLDVSLLKQFSQPIENKSYVKECIQRETAYMRQGLRCKNKTDYFVQNCDDI